MKEAKDQFAKDNAFIIVHVPNYNFDEDVYGKPPKQYFKPLFA